MQQQQQESRSEVVGTLVLSTSACKRSGSSPCAPLTCWASSTRHSFTSRAIRSAPSSSSPPTGRPTRTFFVTISTSMRWQTGCSRPSGPISSGQLARPSQVGCYENKVLDFTRTLVEGELGPALGDLAEGFRAFLRYQ
jgi:hypothetical protein